MIIERKEKLILDKEKNNYHRDSIIHQWFSKDNNVENFINVNFFKNCQYSHWVDGGYERWEKERFQQRNLEIVQTGQTADPQTNTFN